MMFLLKVSLMYVLFFSVVFAGAITDFLVSFLRSKTESFYYQCWIKRHRFLGRFFMYFCDKFLDLKFQLFNSTVYPIWWFIEFHIFVFFMFTFYAGWVELVYAVGGFYPESFAFLPKR